MSEAKTYRISVDGNRTLEVDADDVPADVKTAGALADLCALGENVAGREFSFKADGEVLSRGSKLSTCAKAKLLELIERSRPGSTATRRVTERETEAEVAEPEKTDGQGDGQPPDPDAVPDGAPEEVASWVDRDPERAQRALDAELARGEDVRSDLVEYLQVVIDGDGPEQN